MPLAAEFVTDMDKMRDTGHRLLIEYNFEVPSGKSWMEGRWMFNGLPLLQMAFCLLLFVLFCMVLALVHGLTVHPKKGLK